MMNRTLRVLPATALATLVATSVQAQINNSPPGGNGPTGRGRGPGVEASVVTNARSPEVNADNTITFRLPAPNAKKVRVYTDMPKLGDTPVNGSAGFDMTKRRQWRVVVHDPEAHAQLLPGTGSTWTD